MTEQKVLPCGTIVPGCEFVAHGETTADVMAKLADHSRSAQGVEYMSEALKARVRAALETQPRQ